MEMKGNSKLINTAEYDNARQRLKVPDPCLASALAQHRCAVQELQQLQQGEAAALPAETVRPEAAAVRDHAGRREGPNTLTEHRVTAQHSAPALDVSHQLP